MIRALGPVLLFAIVRPSLAYSPEADALSAEQAFQSLGTFALRRPIHHKPHPKPPPKPHPKPPPPPAHRPDIRSDLDFSNITWPPSLDLDDRAALMAALNISGSFEDKEPNWGAISGNSDGQGVSLGLLNQNLGQGTLQPLLLRLRNEYPDRFAAAFSPEHLESINAMLDAWVGAIEIAQAGSGRLYAMVGDPSADMIDAFSAPQTLSLLDEPEGGESGSNKALSPNGESVAWAARNLYSSGTFVEGWKAELSALASMPEYVSYQVAAALGYHQQALDLERQVGIRDIRTYLLMFDVVVQNGGFHPGDISGYHAWSRKHKKASVQQRLEKLVTLRLAHVRKKYVSDVRSRKFCIIRGTGQVHGRSRNLPQQYSYDPRWPYKS